MNEFKTKQTLTLRSRGSDIQEMAELLEADFSKEQLKKILESLSVLFSSYNIVTSTRILSEYIPEVIRKFTTTKKSDLALSAAIMMASEEFMAVYLNMLPMKVIDVYRLVYNNIYVSFRSAKDIFGRDIGTRKKGWGYSYNSAPMELETAFSLLKSETLGSWSSAVDYVVMPRASRKAMGHYLHPAEHPVVSVATYPLGAGEKIYSTQPIMEPLYPVLHTLYINGTLEMGKTKVTATTIKRISRQVVITEFFPDEKDKNFKNLAATLATSLFCLNASNSLTGRKLVPDSPQKVARNIVSYIRNSSEEILNFFSGLLLSKTYQTIFNHRNFSTLLKTYFTTVSTLACDKWLLGESIENALRNSPDYPDLFLIINPMQSVNYSINNNWTGKYIAPFSIIPQFTVPLIQLLTGALAALGLVELVYTDEPDNAASPLAGIKAVKLTDLGKYALGVTDEYDSTITREGPLFEFDSERLLMRAIGDNNPYEGILRNYLVPVGEHRFKATPERFLEGCRTPRELDKKLNNFRQLSGENLPDNWKHFIDGLLRKSGCLTPPDHHYFIFTVEPDNTELISVLTSDPELRSMTVCAEGFMLLIREDKYDKFCDRMRKFGYLV